MNKKFCDIITFIIKYLQLPNEFFTIRICKANKISNGKGTFSVGPIFKGESHDIFELT